MFEIENYKEINKGSMIANFNLKVIPWGGFIIRGMTYYKKENNRWVSFPSRAYEENGVKKYFSYCVFEDFADTKAFAEKVLRALDEFILKQTSPSVFQPTEQEKTFSDGCPF